jgi:hypothetical protein
MKYWKLAVLFLLVLLLAACGTQPPKYITEVQNNYVVAEPPKKLYEPVRRLKPPYSKVYVDADNEEKERMLFDHIKKQDVLIDALLTDRSSINTWVIEQRAKVNKLQKVDK